MYPIFVTTMKKKNTSVSTRKILLFFWGFPAETTAPLWTIMLLPKGDLIASIHSTQIIYFFSAHIITPFAYFVPLTNYVPQLCQTCNLNIIVCLHFVIITMFIICRSIQALCKTCLHNVIVQYRFHKFTWYNVNITLLKFHFISTAILHSLSFFLPNVTLDFQQNVTILHSLSLFCALFYTSLLTKCYSFTFTNRVLLSALCYTQFPTKCYNFTLHFSFNNFYCQVHYRTVTQIRLKMLTSGSLTNVWGKMKKTNGTHKEWL